MSSIHSVIIEPCKLHEYMQVVQSVPLCFGKSRYDGGAQGGKGVEGEGRGLQGDTDPGD